MEIDHKVYRIELKHTFGISRSVNEWYDVLFIYIKDEAIIGRGEAAPSVRYDETIQKMLKFKGDIFPDYNEENFKYFIEKKAKIVSIKEVTSSGRKIYEYKR